MPAEKRTFSDTERKILAKYIAEENLPYANSVSVPVKARNTVYSRYVKRVIDLLVSGCVLVATSPINLAMAAVTYFDVGRPIIFRQTRVGKDCEEFQIVKFRNMTNDRDEKGDLLPPAERVTRWGRFARRSSLDELLNFWSIFKGDMSLIGPRPLLGSYLDRYSDRHKARHAVRPGLECPVISKSDPTGSKWQNQFENDVWYVENVSFAVDVKMALSLVRLVFDKKESSARGNASRGSFMGYDELGRAIGSSDIQEKYVERLRREHGRGATGASSGDGEDRGEASKGRA